MRLIFTTIGMLLFLNANIVEAALFGKNSFDEHSLVQCPFLMGVQDGDTKNLLIGSGVGYEYSSHDMESFFYGFRESFHACFGAYVGITDDGNTSLFGSNDSVSAETGSALEAGYYPWGLSLLPQGSITPLFLIGLPALYVQLGGKAMILSGNTTCEVSTTDLAGNNTTTTEENCSKESKFRLSLVPELKVGAELRLFAVKFFGAYRVGYPVSIPGGTGASISAILGIGIFF